MTERNREHLVAILSAAAPALAGERSILRETTMFFFDGNFVTAHDGNGIGVSAQFEAKDFIGGVPGAKLLGVLQNSYSEKVEMFEEKGVLRLLLGGAEVTFSLTPGNHPTWVEPELGSASYRLDKTFREMLESVMFSVGASKVLNPEQRGVTLIQEGNRTTALYSTDAVSLSQMLLPENGKAFTANNGRVVLPTPLCEIYLKLNMPNAELHVTSDGVAIIGNVVFSDKFTAEVMLFGAMVVEDEVADFKNVMEEYVPEDPKLYFPVPQHFAMCLDRAMVLLSDGYPVSLGVRSGKLELKADSGGMGKVDDVLPVDAKGHPDITVTTDPKLLRRAVDGRETMCITKSAVVFRGKGDFTHIVTPK